MTMSLLEGVAARVRQMYEGESSGHDWWHMYRVWKMAERLAEEEGADMTVVGLGALLHDIADWKFNNGDCTVGPREARRILAEEGVDAAIVDHVCDIVATISFKGAGVQTPMRTLEGKVVQDADRLDAIGALGIARTFAYGGHKGRAMYDPARKPELHSDFAAYQKSDAPTIHHFYEKLLLLRDRMQTAAGLRVAKERHRFLEEYLARFFAEWEGKA